MTFTKIKCEFKFIQKLQKKKQQQKEQQNINNNNNRMKRKIYMNINCFKYGVFFIRRATLL